MRAFPRNSLTLLTLLSATVLATQTPLAPAQTAPSRQIGNSMAIPADAWKIVQLANEARTNAGAQPLRWDAALAAAARKHCERMAAEGPIAHRYPGELDVEERAAQAGARFSLIEENVALAPTPAEIHEAWMHSPKHRDNLLSPDVDRIGVALVAGRNGLYAVADYSRAVAALSPLQVEATVGKLVAAQGISLSDDPTPARAACAMESGVPSKGARPSFIMRWQGSDLTGLPQPLLDRLASGRYRQAAVGSCSSESSAGSFTAYRLAVLLY
jgi:uncharacterized protein YkwD